MKTFVKKLYSLEKKLKEKKVGPTITVSGLAGAGKTTIAKAIAKKLRLKYYSAGEIFREIAKERKISLEKFSAIRPKWVDKIIDEKTLKLAARGNVVLDGRLTGWIAGRWAEIRIWVDASLRARAERVAKREGISVYKARKIIKERDENDRKRYMEIYGIDVMDKSIYNVIINNSRWSLKEATTKPAEVIKKFWKVNKDFIVMKIK